MAQYQGLAADDIPPDTLDFIINHVFLPPKLPQFADPLPDEKNADLLKILLLTAEMYTNETDLAASPWPKVAKMLHAFETSERSPSAETFSFSICEMLDGGEYPPISHH